MGILFVVFAASMAAATFIENDYGSSAAYNFVYDTRWFELIIDSTGCKSGWTDDNL